MRSAIPASPDRRPARGSETILLVEDEDAVRRLTQRILVAAGYKVIPAASGAEALQACAGDDPISLLVTDVVMPGMSGPSLVEALRRRDPKLKVLYISGYPDLENERARSRLENDPLLRKPFAWSDLLRTVSDILSEATAEETSGDRSRTPPAVSP